MITMNEKKLENKSLPTWVQSLLLLLLFSTVFELTNSSLKSFGDKAIYITIIISIFLFTFTYLEHNFFDCSLYYIYFTATSYLSILAVSMIINHDYNIQLLLQITGVFAFIILSIQTKWSKTSIYLLSFIISISILFLLYDYRFLDFDYAGKVAYKSIFNNPNGLAVILFSSTFIIVSAIYLAKRLMTRIFFAAILAITLFLITQTHARSIYISFFIVIVIIGINFFKKRWTYYSFFISLCGGFLFLISYITLPGTPLGNALNAFSLNTFKKSFFSGRERIWSEMWVYISDSPFIGHGVSSDPNRFESIANSAHNQYLQIILESGILGLLAFLFFLYNIWLLLLKNQNHFIGSLSIAYFIAILFYETFEVTLFQNNFNIGFIQWLIITMGINLSNHSSGSNKHKNRTFTKAIRGVIKR